MRRPDNARRMRRAILATLSVVLLAGCGDIFGTKDAHHPGTQLGSFHVTAARTSNSCGEGALGTSSSWEFDVRLARQDTEIFWDNGAEIITGALAADGVSFSFQSGVAVDMRTEED